MKRFLFAIAAIAAVSTGCALKGATIPGAPIPFAKADYTVLGATNAEECGAYILAIDFGHLFKNEGAAIMPGSYGLDGAIGMQAGFVQTGALTAEGRRALYVAMEKMPEATHLLAPRVTIETTGIPLGPVP
ncbi:MAG: hypothetical protein RIT28_3185, partial [Pseudomonadota bacterium]